MADNVVRQFIIKVNSKGQLEAIKEYKQLDSTLNQTAKSAGEADRRLKGVAGATSNSSKEFAKQAQGLGGIVRIYATVAANVFALSSAYNVLKRNADLEILKTSSEQLSISTGQNFNKIAQNIKDITGGAIGFREAFQSANLALSGGLSGVQSGQIAEIATKAANALGRSVPEAVQRLTQAIVKAEPELADEFGIVLRVTEATNEYAKSIGKLPTELTTAQKQQAIFNQFLEQGTEKFANVQIQTNPYDKLAASFVEVSNSVVEFIRLPLDPFIKLLSESGVALAAVFAAVAGGIASLLLPELKNLSATMTEVAAKAQGKAFNNYNAAILKSDEAIRNLTNDTYDYIEVVRSGLKKTNLQNLNIGGLSKGQNKQLIDELFDKDNVGEDLRNSILNNVFSGNEGKMRGIVGNFIKGLNKEIAKAGTDLGATIEFQGFKGSVVEAQRTVEALGIASKTTGQLQAAAATEGSAAYTKLASRVGVATASVNKFNASLKFAATSGYAEGLEKGLIKSILSIKTSFTDLSTELGGGFAGKLGAIFGSGAKVAGGFLSTITSIASKLGTFGIIVGILTPILSGLADALGITSEASRKAEEGLEEYKKSAETGAKTLKNFKEKAIDSFEGQVDSATVAINLLQQFDANLLGLEDTFAKVDQASQSFWYRMWTGSKQAVEVLKNATNEYRNVSELADEATKNRLGSSVSVDITDNLQGTSIRNRRGKLVGREQINPQEAIDNINESLKGSVFTAEQQGDRIILKAEAITEIKEKDFKILAEAGLDGKAFTTVEQVGKAINNETRKLSKESSEAKRTIVELGTAFEDVNTTLSKTANQLNNTSKEYTAVTNVLSKYKAAVEAGQGDKTADILKNASSEVKALAAYYAGAGKSFEELTGSQAISALEAYQADLKKFAVSASDSALNTAKLNEELVSIKERARQGDISAISDEFTIQRSLIDEQVRLLRDKNAELEISLRIARSSRGDSEAIAQKEKEKEANSAKIAELIAKQNTEYSQQRATSEILIKNTTELAKIEKTRLSIIQSQKSVLDAIASSTGSIEVQRQVLNFEKQITAQKVAQLNAEIASKRAQLSDAVGPKAASIQAEIDLLTTQLDTEKQLSALKQITGNKDLELQQLDLINNKTNSILNSTKARLEVERDLLGIIADNPFLSQQANDAAKLLEVEKDLGLVVQEYALSKQNISNIQQKITKEEAQNEALRAKGYKIEKETATLQNLRNELLNAESDARRLVVEQEEKILKLREEQYKQAKKNVSPFEDPELAQQLLGEEFRRAAKEFGEQVGDSISIVVGITLGTIDSGIDAFVDAVRNGEDVLKATKDALTSTFLDLNSEFIKDTFKKEARSFIANLFPALGDFGKSPELIAQEQTNNILNDIKLLLSKQNISTVDTKDLFDNLNIDKILNTNVGNDAVLKSEQALIGSMNKNTEQAKMLAEQTADFFGGNGSFFDQFGGIFDGLVDNIGSIFSNLDIGGMASSFGGGIADFAQTAISLFFAKGGITNQLSKRIPMYANGGVTGGPELAMVGEGPTKEAIVPLPDNRSIPVTLNGNPQGDQVTNNFEINITGVQGTEEGIRRSASQVALEVARVQSKSQGRIG